MNLEGELWKRRCLQWKKLGQGSRQLVLVERKESWLWRGVTALLYAFLKCKWADAVATNSHTKALETMLPWRRDCLENSMHIQAHHCLGIAEEQHFETLVKMLQVLTAWTKAEGGA